MKDGLEAEIAGGLDAESMAALEALAGRLCATEPDATATPFAAPLLLLERASASPLIERLAPAAGGLLVNEYLSIACARRPVAGETLRVAAKLEHKGTVTLDAAVFAAAGTAPIVEIRVQLRVLEKGALGAMTGMAIDRALRGEAQHVRTLPVDQQAVSRFTALTGDPNPLHDDPAYAAAAGLAGTVLPGALLAGLAEPLLRRTWPGRVLSRLAMRFMAPAPVGEAVHVAIQDRGTDADRQSVRLLFHRPAGMVTAIGDAQLR